MDKIIIISLMMISVASCSASNNAAVLSQADNGSNQEKLRSLPAQELSKGECAVFLWGTESTRPLVFTQTIKTGNAKALIDNAAVSLIRIEASNIIIPGFYENQTFSFDLGSVNIKLRPDGDRNLYEGIKIPSGIMSIKRNDKSENIISVSGLLGCNLDR